MLLLFLWLFRDYDCIFFTFDNMFNQSTYYEDSNINECHYYRYLSMFVFDLMRLDLSEQ